MNSLLINIVCFLLQLSESDKTKLEEAVDDKIKWLESNQDADGEAFQKKKKELEEIAQPIISKLYQSTGGVPPPSPSEDDDAKDEL